MSVTPAREPVYAALFALLDSLKTGSGPLLKTTSRRLQLIQNLDVSALPAGYQAQDDQAVSKPSTSMPGVMKWKAHWFLYAYEPSQDAAPSVQLNLLVDNAVALLNPTPGADTFTLGGLVQSAAVEGNIQIFEGVLGDLAVAIIPITLLVPGYRP